MHENTIEIIGRAVIINGNNILLCKHKTLDYYFFPGGHVEFGEILRDGLVREIKEELGVDTISQELIGILENQYTQEGREHHEVNFVFSVTLPTEEISSAEDHIEFMWLPVNQFANGNILPPVLRGLVVAWIRDKKFFIK